MFTYRDKVIFSVLQLKIREGQTVFKARVLAQNITSHAQLSQEVQEL